VRDDEDMQKLVDSIKENGVLTNLTVRPRAEGGLIDKRMQLGKRHFRNKVASFSLAVSF